MPVEDLKYDGNKGVIIDYIIEWIIKEVIAVQTADSLRRALIALFSNDDVEARQWLQEIRSNMQVDDAEGGEEEIEGDAKENAEEANREMLDEQEE
jgi:hypothetical protein